MVKIKKKNTSLRSNVDQYFSRLIERSNVSNFVEQLSCIGKAKLSEIKFSKLGKQNLLFFDLLSNDSKLLISVVFIDC